MMHYSLCLFLFLFPFTVVSATYLADDIEPGDNVNDIQLPLTKISAAELIKLESNGKILSVNEEYYKDKHIFKIKVLHSNGTIKEYLLDSSTARPPE